MPPQSKNWHFIPLPGMHSTEAARVVTALVTQLTPWLEKAQSRLQFQQKTPPESLTDPDEIRCALAGALTRAMEWDGYTIAHELRLISRWPVDFDLCARLHRWSCALKTTRLAAWKASKERKSA
jgi:hypothetical protein